jgi:uncharacterized phiE125 gp8 family phage protein
MILTHFLTCFAVSTAPAIELAPVTLAEAKAHLRIVDSADDAYITALVGAAADKIERDTGIVCRARNLSIVRDSFMDSGVARIPAFYGPVNSIGAVVYDATDGTEQTLASDQYRLRQFAGMAYIVPAFGVSWPATEGGIGAVRVTLNAGYASNDDVPDTLRHAALLLIGHLYENREAVNIGQGVTEVPLGYDALIRAHRLRMVA